MPNILFATSEAQPLVKTGGLGDVSGSLPAALRELDNAVRVVLPAYREVLRKIDGLKIAAVFIPTGESEPVRLLEAEMPDSGVPLWLIDSPRHFDRDGGPYGNNGGDWPDNAERYALFARAVVDLALDRVGSGWRADVVHCNDWQTGLIPALLSREPKRPGTVFTIHNLAYQGVFDSDTFTRLRLPPELWHPEGLEFYGDLSFIKGGLAYADWITTVSPTYAGEIRTEQFGYGLQGLLEHRATHLRGILNGVDYTIWDPANDTLIPQQYDAGRFDLKAANKRALQERLGLPQADVPVIGLVSRLVEQKGIDLVLGAIPHLFHVPVQLAVLGGGEEHLEEGFRKLAATWPEHVGVHIGYDERCAHLIEAGADMFLMPSRFEPCGLNQIYSLRYGTVPIVRRTGGLADTVVDATEEQLANGSATGFVFEQPAIGELLGALSRALELYADRPRWRTLAAAGMAQDYSWEKSARHYLEVYDQAIAAAATQP